LSLPGFDPRTVQLEFVILVHNYKIRLNKNKTEMMIKNNTALTLNTAVITSINLARSNH